MTDENIWRDDWTSMGEQPWQEGLLSVMAYTADQFGKPLWDLRRVKPTDSED